MITVCHHLDSSHIRVLCSRGKGARVFVKFCLYPNFGVPHVGLANNHSCEVDKVMMLWNKKVTAVL